MSGFEITREAIEAKIDGMNKIVEQVKQAKGNAAKRLAEATQTALGENVVVKVSEFPAMSKDGVQKTKFENEPALAIRLGDLATYVATLQAWAENACQEVVGNILRTSGSDDSVDALTEKFAAEAKLVESMLTVAPHMNVDTTDLVIPTLRGTSRIATAVRSSRAGTTKQRMYRVENGQRSDLAGGGGTFSAAAWYWGTEITGDEGDPTKNSGRAVSADRLESFLRAQGIESPKGKAWTFEKDGVTFGMDTTSADNAQEEE